MSSLTNITHYNPYVIQLGFSQKILIILLPKLGRKITFFPHKAQHYLVCGQNPKKAQNSKSPTTMWLIQSPTTMWHYLQSPLLHGNTLQNHFYKAQIPIWHLFSQSPNSYLTFISQSPNSYLASIFARPKF